MKNQEELNKELSELSPFLQELKLKDDGLRVPAYYFDNLSDEVWQRLQEESQLKPQTQPRPAPPAWWAQWRQLWNMLLQPQYGLSLASVAVLVCVAIFLLRPAQVETPLAQITAEEASQYVTSNIDEFDMAMLEELSAKAEAEEKSAATSPSPNDSVMDQYLEEIIDEIDLEDLEDLL